MSPRAGAAWAQPASGLPTHVEEANVSFFDSPSVPGRQTQSRLSQESTEAPSRASQASARSTTSTNVRPSTSEGLAGERRWRGEAKQKVHIPEIWRAGGHPGDMGWVSYEKTPKEKVQQIAEEKQKRTAGEFVTSGGTCHWATSEELPPPEPSYRTAPRLSPYTDIWRVGVPPAGRWVLEGALPRWVMERPATSCSQGSVEGWFCGYKDLISEADSWSQVHTSRPSTGPAGKSRTSDMTPQARHESEGDDTFPSEEAAVAAEAGASSSDSDSDSEETLEANKTAKMRLANSTRTGDACPILRKSRKSAFALNMKMQNRKIRRHTIRQQPKDVIEDLDDILTAMPEAGGNETPEKLTRFEWIGRKTRISFAMPEIHTLPNRPDSKKKRSGSPSSPRKAATSKQNSSRMSTASRMSVMSKNSRAFGWSGENSRMSTTSTVSTASAMSTLSTLSSFSKQSVSQSPRGGRDQRSDIKRLQGQLINSAQKAFDPAVWDACGIESDHLKKHNFANALLAGLSLKKGKNEAGGVKFEDDDLISGAELSGKPAGCLKSRSNFQDKMAAGFNKARVSVMAKKASIERPAGGPGCVVAKSALKRFEKLATAESLLTMSPQRR